MERRTPTIENLDLPRPWSDDVITRACWEANRDYLMTGAMTGYGHRPDPWWLYERNMEPPPKEEQPRKLYEMGELKGDELQRALVSWRADLERGRIDHIPPTILRNLGVA